MISTSLPRRIALILAGSSGIALAQPSPMPGGGPPTGEDEPKPEGIAEAAPKAAGLLGTTPSLPPPRDRRKKFEVITVDGYLRTRGDWFKNLALGFDSTPDSSVGSNGGAPHPEPIGCEAPIPNCPDSLKTSNLRLRLEPSIQLSETIAVHTQIDLFDNVVMGAPAEGAVDPDAIKLRRAWAEVATGLGHLKFGRMPDHFGLGIAANSGRRANTDFATWETLYQPSTLANVGGTNPVGYDLDSDHGDTLDRLSFTAMIPGTPFRAVAAVDWPAATRISSEDGDVRGQPFDADDGEDQKGWMLSVARFDAPADFADRVARGKLGLNYAARLVRRTQDRAYDLTLLGADDPISDAQVIRGFRQYQPDVWVKVGLGKLLFEAELTGQFGSIDNFNQTGIDGKIDISAWGGVARVSTHALDNKLGFGLELGVATGDETDAVDQGNTHYSKLPALGGNDRSINRFVFDPDYEIDMILFRELLGAVHNSFYARPWMRYDLTSSITFRAQNVTAAALRPVSTPGNSEMWGLEFDTDLGYEGNGFHAGIAYGLFLPLGAMNHPRGDSLTGDGDLGYGVNAGDAGNAHSVQARFAVEF